MKSRKIPLNVKLIIIMTVVMLSVIGLKYLVEAGNKEQITINANYDLKQYMPVHESQINIDEIIQNNKNNISETIETEEIDLDYITKYNDNPELPKGLIQVIQEGRNGKQQAIIKKTYENGNLINEEQIGSKVTKSSIDKIVEVGTANYKSTYKIKIGDTLYVTSNTLILRTEPDINSENVAMINKNDSAKLLEIYNDWYKIAHNNEIGWVNSNCMTYINPNQKYEEGGNLGQKSKAELLSKLSYNMSLNKPSGLSLEQFKKIFENEDKDKKGIFKNNAQYFYYIEKQYNINGVFIAAVGVHESAWGTSKIATDKNNLFGYGAYDSSPYNSAYNFADYSEGIDLVARVFVKYYLNPAGTRIYESETATGKYYNGPTLNGINKRYATDKSWANSVYKWMEYLYNRL